MHFMELITLLKGFALGFVLAMSVGPIALLCISNTLGRGPRLGFAVGLGAATADGIYAFVAAFGLGLLVSLMSDYEIGLKVMGGIFLIYLGWKIMTSTFTSKRVEVNTKELLKTYCLVVGLTLISPTTIATYMGAFAGMGLGNTGGDLTLSVFLGLGALMGSALWHSVLVFASTLLKTRIKNHHLMWLNKCSGALLCLFGLASFVSILL
jgi:threonine/homoserine/homoserine lactone efflux protein